MNQGLSGAIQEKEWCPFLYLGVVTIENGASRSSLNMVINFTLFIYIWKGYSINKGIFPKELEIGNTIYSCSFFFKETNSEGSSGTQHGLLTETCAKNFFFNVESWTVFSNQVQGSELMSGKHVNIFWLKHASLYTLHIFGKFQRVWTTQPPKFS